MLLSNMTLGQEIWCKHPNKKEYYFGIIKNIGHRPRIQLNQLGMHGKDLFPYARDIYPKEAFLWCGECDGDGWVNFSHYTPLHPGEVPDEKVECESCSGMGVLKTEIKQ